MAGGHGRSCGRRRWEGRRGRELEGGARARRAVVAGREGTRRRGRRKAAGTEPQPGRGGGGLGGRGQEAAMEAGEGRAPAAVRRACGHGRGGGAKVDEEGIEGSLPRVRACVGWLGWARVCSLPGWALAQLGWFFFSFFFLFVFIIFEE